MGQKVHPYGFRLGYNRGWHSRWFAKKDFGKLLLEDLKLKKELKSRPSLSGAGISQIEIDRAANRLKIIIYTSRPGIIIGRKGAEIDKLKHRQPRKGGKHAFEDHVPLLECRGFGKGGFQQLPEIGGEPFA